MNISGFEEIEGWQRGRDLARKLYALASRPPLSGDFGLRDQLRKAALSVVSNIAEGFERNGDRERRHFLSIAKGSAGEIRAQLIVASDGGLIVSEDFRHLSALAVETGRLIGGFMKYLDRSR